jgi:hypothetical protein
VKSLSRRRYLTIAAAAIVAMVGVCAGSALAASPTGTVQETISIGVRSVTVTPNSIAMCPSVEPLTFPNGICYGPPVTITNGPAAGHIDVNGADAVPSDDSGSRWSLCTICGTCTGVQPPPDCSVPGQDQYEENSELFVAGEFHPGPQLTDAAQCDSAFDEPAAFACTASPAQVATEPMAISGPTSSTDPSPTFTTSVTWTAVP